jgi:hypothetical protein
VLTEDGLIPQTTWRQYVDHIYMAGNRPIIGSSKQKVNFRMCSYAQYDTYFIDYALTRKCWSFADMYTVGNAGTGSTYRDKFKALGQWRIVPSMLRNTTHRNNVGSSF